MRRRPEERLVFALLFVVGVVACARNIVTPVLENRTSAAPRPSRVLVYDPDVTETVIDGKQAAGECTHGWIAPDRLKKAKQ